MNLELKSACVGRVSLNENERLEVPFESPFTNKPIPIHERYLLSSGTTNTVRLLENSNGFAERTFLPATP